MKKLGSESSNRASRVISGLSSPGPSGFFELLKRTGSAVLGGVIILASLAFSHYLLALLVFLVVMALALWEYYSLLRRRRHRMFMWLWILAGVWLYLGCWMVVAWDSIVFSHLLLAFPLFFVPCCAKLFDKADSDPFVSLGLGVLGLVYVCLPFCVVPLALFYGAHYDPRPVSGFLLLLWSHDIAAYVVGRWFGKKPLFARISPAKTWEGVAGGFAASLLTASLFASHFGHLTRLEWLGMALLVSVTATLGDLVASALKRSVEAKESGKGIPGHGGFLDRFDSFLFSFPCFVIYLVLFAHP